MVALGAQHQGYPPGDAALRVAFDSLRVLDGVASSEAIPRGDIEEQTTFFAVHVA